MPCFPPCKNRFPYQEQDTKPKQSSKLGQKAPLPLPPQPCKKTAATFCATAITPQIPKTKTASQNAKELRRKVELSKKDLSRLYRAAKVQTEEDRVKEINDREEFLRRLEEESERTRLYFKNIDDKRKAQEDAQAIVQKESETDDKVKVLEQAFLDKHEDDEKVKEVNRIIMNAKCHAVRDAQIQEKYRLNKEMHENNLRIEKKLLQENSIVHNSEAQSQKRNILRKEYSIAIRKQLEEREKLKFLEAERIDEEARIQRAENEILQEERKQEYLAHRERQRKFRDELTKVIEMSTTFKRMLCEQENEAEMRIAAYRRSKDAQSRADKKEKDVQQQELHRTQQRIFGLVQKAIESRTQREELAYLRERERIDKDYRQKEKEAVLKKLRVERELAEAREAQMLETRHRQAFNIAQAEQEFHNTQNTSKKEEANRKQLEAERNERNRCYRLDIIQQMNDNELNRRRALELERAEVFAARERERQRELDINAIIAAKVDAMREACLPEKYIKDVEKQLKRLEYHQLKLVK